MNNNFLPLLFSFLAGFSTLIGASIIFFTKKPSKKLLTFSLGLSSGVMISVSFIDLIPNAKLYFEKNIISPYIIVLVIFFLLIGVLISFLIDKFIPSEEKHINPKDNKISGLYRVGLISTIAIIIHNFPEGMATYISGYQNIKLGALISLAITLHNIPEGISIAIPIYFATNNKLKSFKYAFVSSIAEPLGAFLTFLFLKPYITDITLGVLFSLISGIMLYLSFSELIPSSKKFGHNTLSTLSIFLGITIMLLSHILI